MRHWIGVRAIARAGAVCLCVLMGVGSAWSDDVLDNVPKPGPNRPDEPLAKTYRPGKAVDFLDAASVHWQKKRKCFTCHTNLLYLYARPMVSKDADAHQFVRKSAEQLVTQRWVETGPRWDAEIVATAAALAFNDRVTTGKLHPVTKSALDKIWTVQREDGGWDWLKCGWPPMESDDDYGVVLAALAVSVAPSDYATTPQAKLGMQRLRKYLQANPGPTLHHRAMLLWAASYDKTLMPPAAQQACQSELLKLQKADGGWALPTFGDWERGDGTRQDLEKSDGYGTGFATYVLLRSGLKPESDHVAKGLKWLRANQRESGRWFTRSLHADGMHYITHAGTAMAVMALAEAKGFAQKR